MTDKIKTPVSLKSILQNESEILHALTSHTDKIKNIQNIISNSLEPPLSQQFIVANYNNEAMTIHANSSAWASKLRFNIPKILHIVQSQCGLPELQSIRIKVIPTEHKETTQHKELVLSNQSRRLIAKIADSIDSEEIRSTLIRLSKL